LRCRRLVIATPVQETARLLRPVLPEAASALDSVESVSMVVLNLGFKRTDVGHALDGFGFLAPHHETEFPLMGVLWADSIFPHHAPADHRLLRVFFGGARDPDAINRSDQELLDTAQPELRRLLQVAGEPVLVDVCRYPAAIPQYNLGYRKKVDRLNTLIDARPDLHLVGNYLEGVSLNDCIRCGTNVAKKMIESTENTSVPAKVPELATA
jgi:oxygen-dependent protoporphyrinogen oxidase